jgi:LCP family protein required for cell wall assembly
MQVITSAPPRRSRRWLWVVWPLVILGAIGACGFVYLSYLGYQPGRQFRSFLSPPFHGAKQVNVLILGIDGKPGERDPRRSDTMMLARIDLSQQRIGVISIPRDFRVVIPGHEAQKINAAYSLGGVPLAEQTVNDIVGLPCDYYVTVSSEGLKRLVDALGGVEINVDKRMYYHDRWQGLLIDLQPGLQRLNGEQAVGYVRYRHDRLGDLTRVQRQQLFLRAVLREATRPRNIARIPRLLKRFKETVDTDLLLGDLEAIKNLAKDIGPDRIKSATLEGTPVTIGGVSYVEPDLEESTRVVNEVLLGVLPRVAIVNATEIPGVEAGLVKRLNDRGYGVTEVRFASHPTATSHVIDPERHKDEADEIHRWLDCGTVVRSDGDEVPGADITVLLGTDYLGKESK